MILDSKTRWNSLLIMLERFDVIKLEVRKALIDIKSYIHFNENEYHHIKIRISILKPIKLAVDALCRGDANLITTDTALSFMMENLGNDPLSLNMKNALNAQIKERRIDFSDLLHYLHFGKQGFSSHSCLNIKINKTAIHKMILGILHR